MKDRNLGVLVLDLCAARADLTMRHTIDFKFGPPKAAAPAPPRIPGAVVLMQVVA